MSAGVLVPDQNLRVPSARPRIEWVLEVDRRVRDGLAVTLCQDDDGGFTAARVRRVRARPRLAVVGHCAAVGTGGGRSPHGHGHVGGDTEG